MISCVFDPFYPQCPKPVLTYFCVSGVQGPLGGLLLLKGSGQYERG